MAWTEQQFRDAERRVALGKAKMLHNPPAGVRSESDQIPAGKRVRLDAKKSNKLEAEWLAYLRAQHPGITIRSQAIRLKIGAGAWYKPDMMAWLNMRVVCWETKGPKQMKNVDRGVLALKSAALQWPEVLFILAWKENGSWKQQEIIP